LMVGGGGGGGGSFGQPATTEQPHALVQLHSIPSIQMKIKDHRTRGVKQEVINLQRM